MFVLIMLIISVAINVFMFFPAFIFKTDKLTDISYAITFVIVALVGYILSSESTAQEICLVLVIIWALRLGIFLFVRINKFKKDSRFDGMRDKFFLFLRFWLLQGTTVFIILIPCILLWSQTHTMINWLSVSGIAVFAVGFLIETIADIQKYRFHNKKTRTWIDTGIWRMSRHPNYLGEIIIWVGAYLFVIPSLSTSLRLIALAGPLYIAVLLIFVSGIPILEKSSNKKWGRIKFYQKYKSEVPVLIPSLSSIRRIFK